MSVTLHPTTSVGFHSTFLAFLLYVTNQLDPGPLTQETKSSLIITNCNALPIAFKVLTNAGLRSYVVRPNLGRVEPGGSVEVVVTLQPKDEDPPPDSKCKDKFLIKSTMITREKEEMSVHDIWAAPGSSDAASKVHLQKLRVVYLPPAKDRSPPEAARSVAHSVSTRVN
ncbi:PapD-like protein [Amanita rubescens]|nr:PapD-like protein [Amanita rubescens]